MSKENLAERRASLSQSKQALLEKMLRGKRRGQDTRPAIPRRAEQSHYPLSFAQQRLWFTEQISGASALYVIPSAVRIEGVVNISALERVFNAVLQRHELLRARFVSTDGEPVQEVSGPLRLDMTFCDLSGIHASYLEATKLADCAAQKPLSLSDPPLIAADLIRISECSHLLLLRMHHIIADEWSLGVLLGEVAELYQSMLDGNPATLPELRIQYADFAAWEREWVNSAECVGSLDYWKSKMASLPLPFDLPFDRARTSQTDFRGGSEPVAISASLTKTVKAIGEAHGATVFMSLLAVFSALIYRYTGRDDIVIGSPVAGRNQKDLNNLLGCFVNMIPLRLKLEPSASFAALLRDVRNTALEAYSHQDLPFERLIEQLKPARQINRGPLFDVVFVFQNTPAPAVEMPGLKLEAAYVHNGMAKFDLTLSLAETEDRIAGYIEYSSELFDRSTIREFADHFVTLLENAVGEPETWVSRLPLLSDSERSALIENGRPAMHYAEMSCVHELFDSSAARGPDRIAVVFGEARVTYECLDQRANQLARHLRKQGVGPEILVCVLVDRSIELIVSVLGVLKAGAAYVPVDPAYPAERIALIVEESGCRAVITESRFAGLVSGAGVDVTLIDEPVSVSHENTASPMSGAAPSMAAYVIYTSGSTGTPKGVVVSHSNVARLFSATNHWFDFSEQDVWTLFHSFAFDFSVWEIWGALLFGGQLVVVPYLTSRSPASIRSLLYDEGVTVFNQTPSAFRQLIEVDREAEAEPETLALRTVIFGGEALDPRGLEPWIECHGVERPRLVNMYGITETTVHVTYRPIENDDVRNATSGPKSSPIGCAIADLGTYILDAQFEPVPSQVAGELFVAGDGVARGYFNRPDITAERFVPDPHSNQAGTRVYRSGDLARRKNAGDMEYLGRADQQIKLRGFRIEPGEIESALLNHPSVSQVKVLATEDASGHPRLTAYVVPSNGSIFGATEYRAFLRERLPDYMVPTEYIEIAGFQLTAHGKLDVSTLPGFQQSELRISSYQAPRSATEMRLADIWQQVLGKEQVGITDNFFDLGGDSILTLKVISSARQAGIELEVADLFRHQTIEELARAAGSVDSLKADSSIAPFSLLSEQDRLLMAADVEDAYPLTMLQAGMLFHSLNQSEGSVYHNVSTLRLRGRFDRELFESVVNGLVKRHPILRTSFDLASFSQPLQVVHKQATRLFEVIDLIGRPRALQDEEAAAFFQQEKARKFDWSQAPLLRITIHCFAPDLFQMTFSEHHAILDGWSVASMLSELFGRYITLLYDRPEVIEPPSECSFADYVKLEIEAAASAASRDYWLGLLSDTKVAELPRLPGQARSREIVSNEIRIPRDVALGMQTVSRRSSVPIKHLLVAAHLKVLSLLTGQSEVVTGLVTNGRPESAGGERLLGLFLNTVPFCYRLDNGSWLDLARSAFDLEASILPHRRFPLPEIQKLVDRRTLFQSAFNFVHFHIYRSVLGLEGMEMEDGTFFEETDFALVASFSLDPETSTPQMQLSFDLSVFDSCQVSAIGRYYSKALALVALDPQVGHFAVSLLSEPELHELLYERNQSSVKYESEIPLQSLFEANAHSLADAVASCCDGRFVTYSELNCRANGLANYLIRAGAGPETLVCLALERSIEMVIAILAVLKSGAAYVPADPAYPAERIRLIVEDSQCSIAITESRLASRLPTESTSIVVIDSMQAQLESEDQGNPQPRSFPESVAYVIYTSGSTGLPKGVAVTHRNVTRLFQATEDWYGFSDCDVWTLFHSIAFDFSVWELWGALVYGGRLVIVPFIVSRSPDEFHRLLIQERVTVLNQTPSAFRQLIAVDESSGAEGLALKEVIFGGEAVDLRALIPWITRHPHTPRLVNMYGITETTVHVTYRPLDADEIREAACSPIGGPIPDLSLYVLGEDMDQLPTAVSGEAFIGGDGLARGYLNHPDMTAKRFVPDPLSTRVGSRLYRSGDVARLLPRADSDHLGRRDQQVKIRGFRIELGEIESALVMHSSVSDARVLAETAGSGRSNPGEPRMLAYVIPSEETSFSEPEIRAFLKDRLPDYMVPAVIVHVDHFPLTPHGKLDTRQLLSIENISAFQQMAFDPPRNEKEEVLAEIWSDVLGVKQVGVNENFFDIGGDSIRAIQVRAKAEQAGIAFSIQQLFASPTIRQLASANDTRHERNALTGQFDLISKSDRGRLPADVEDAYPLSSLQMGMLFHSLYDQSSTTYHNVNSMRLRGTLNLEALRQAIAEVVRRHAVLRTSFDLASFSEPLQLVHNKIDTPLTVEDLRGHRGEEQVDMLAAFFETERDNKFDLLTAPLIRFHVHELADDEFQFSWTEHHAILDGWSVASMITQIVSVYHEINETGRPKDTRQPTVAFRDFIALELDSTHSELCRTFWQRKLEGRSEADRRHRGDRKQRGIRRLESVERLFEGERLKAIKGFAAAAGVPLKSALLSVHFRAQAFLTGSSRTIVRIVSNGRPEENGADEILGLFLNTLPLPLELSGLTLFDLARSAFELEQEVLPYRRYPLAHIERITGAQGGLDSLFTFVHFHVVDSIPQNTGIEVVDLTSAIETNFGLEVEFILEESLNRLRQVIKYDPAEFGSEPFGAITDYYTRGIEQLIGHPHDRIEELSLLSRQELDQIVYDFNRSRVERPAYTVLDLFERQVTATPDSTALAFEAHALTYQALDDEAANLAAHLLSVSASAESMIGVSLERSLEMAIAVLGVLKSGAAYLPLDPTYPSERLAFMLADSHAPVVITSKESATVLPSVESSVVLIEDALSQTAAHSGAAYDALVDRILPDSAAYVIYTSGSTGRPKGVVMTHRALFNIISWQLEQFGREPSATTLQFAPLSFDVAIQEMMSTWCSGGSLMVVSDDLRRDTQRLLRVLRDCDVARIFMPFIAVQQIAEAVDESGSAPRALRQLITAGEQLRITPQIRRLFDSIPECRFENQYGPTESHVVTSYPLGLNREEWEDLPPIGRPVSNTQIYILNEWLQAVPNGVAGELLIAGDSLARGYHDRPVLTSEKFLPDAFSLEPGRRMYRTGDLARHERGGEIEFLGRMDRQTKVRGFRVETGEIEAVLDEISSIAQCAVEVRQDDRGQNRLVAYIVTDEESGISQSDLKRSISVKLPDYMVPSLLVELDRMPLTPSGKVDRRALPPPDFSIRVSEDGIEYVPPSNILEAALAGIWEEVLSRGPIGIDDDFFDAGGNSLYATQVISRARRRLRIELPVRLLFESRTIRRLALEIAGLPTEIAEPVRVAPTSSDDLVPLSPAQHRLWLIDRLTPGTSAYNMPIAMWLKGSLSTHSLEASLNEVVRRHASLRTSFPIEREAPPHQVVAAYEHSALKTVDLTHLSQAEARTVGLRLASEDAARAFDLETGAPLRAVLVTTSNEQRLFVLNMHHIVSDGWSLNILTTELTKLYSAYREGRTSSLEELPIQYADYAILQHKRLTGHLLESGLGYWKHQLAGAPPELTQPTDHPRSASPSYQGASRSFEVDSNSASAVIDAGRQGGATAFATLLTAFAVLLSRHACEDDLVIGTPMSGRNLVETEPLIGFFVNSLPLRMKIDLDCSFPEVVQQAKETVLSATTHQDIPFEMIVDELQPDRVAGRSPIFQVMFTLDNKTGPKAEFPGLDIDFVDLGSEQAKFDLTLALAENEGSFSGSFQFRRDLFDPTTIQRMIGHFCELLRSIASSPGTQVADLTMLPAYEIQQLCFENNDTLSEYPFDDCVHHLFDGQVRLTPDAVAVVARERAITYSELDRRSSALAARLLALAPQVDTPIGLCAARSIGAVTALLAILKSGAAYLPLDPTFPEQRIATMIEDSGAQIVIAEGDFSTRFEKTTITVVSLADAAEEAYPGYRPPRPVASDNLAYIVYTSGSTGKPKGIAVTHRAVLRLVTNTNYVALNSRDVVAQASTITFDAATFEIWGALLNGARLVITERETTLSPSLFGEFAQRHQFTTLFLTTALFNELVRETPGCLSGIGQVLFGGEAVDSGRVAQFLGPGDHGRLLHVYGPTETTTYATWHQVNHSGLASNTIPIGRPISNTTVYLLDKRLQPAPSGVSGEMFIGGDGLARGYVSDPAHTAEVFIPDSFSSIAGSRLYKTGDLGRRLSSGDIEFLGRIDAQVKIRGFRIEPAEVETALRKHPKLRDAAVVVKRTASGRKKLVAYVVRARLAAASASGAPVQTMPFDDTTPQSLRSFLKETMPDYMVPSAFVYLEALPLNQNGKIDRKALPEPSVEMEGNDTPSEPSDDMEQALASLWAECLGLNRVGVNENFFELGGDSILSIQLAARAKRAGLSITPSLIFQHQTIAELASVIRETQAVVPAIDAGATGTVPLTPIQCWFFEQNLPDPAHFNLDLTFELARELSTATAVQAISCLIDRHPVLNSRFDASGGEWRQSILERNDRDVLSIIDLSGLATSDAEALFAVIAGEAQQKLNLADGPLVKAVLAEFPEDRTGRLFLTIHHLVVDWVSWRILLADLDDLAKLMGQGIRPDAAAEQTSFKAWAEMLTQYASSAKLAGEAPYWLELGKYHSSNLHLDSEGVNNVGSERWFDASLTESLSRSAIQEAPRRYGAHAQDLMLAALLLTWSELTGSDSILLDFESHGRAESFPGMDLSGTVGWFTSIFPLVLHLPKKSDNVSIVNAIRRQLDSVPNRGIGYGTLKYLSQDREMKNRFEALPKPQVSFNYLGQFDQALPQDSLFLPIGSRSGEYRNPAGLRSHVLDIQLSVIDGKLGLALVYSENLLKRETLERFAGLYLEKLNTIVTQAPALPVGGSRGDATNLVEASTIDALKARFYDIEDAYPLTPMQEGMLLHSLDDPNTGVYCTQIVLTLEGAVDATAFLESWQQLVQRHAIFRTGFAWKGLKRPVQAVRRRATLDIERRDWRGMPEEKQERELDRYLSQDRHRGFDLEQPLLMRLMLATTGGSTSWLAWSFHHVQLDGWCLSIVIDELRELYAAATGGRRAALADPPPYRKYIEWLHSRNANEAQAFWANELDGLSAKATSEPEREEVMPFNQIARTRTANLSSEATARLAAFSRSHRLTLNTVILGAWAIVLGSYTQGDGVVFGTVVSGRPPELPDVERMIGLFINTLPLRVRLEADESVLSLLQRIQDAQTRLRRYEYCSLSQIKKWAGFSGNHELFDTIVAFENYPWRESGEDGQSALRITGIRAEEQTNFPLVLAAVPGKRLSLRLSYFESRFDETVISSMLEQLEILLVAISTEREQTIADISPATPIAPSMTEPAPKTRQNQAATLAAHPEGSSRLSQLEKERILAKIWCETLGVADVRADHDFFSLGGDSILSMQVCSRAAGFGLKLTPGQVMRERFLANVAAMATDAEPPIEDNEPVFGELPLTPIQHWFFELNLGEPDTYNQSVLFETTHGLELEAVEAACREIISHHDALRMRFRTCGSGIQQLNERPTSDLPLHCVELKPSSDRTLLQEVEDLADEIFRSIKLDEGPLLRVVLFSHARDGEQWVLFVVHHLAIDGVSWRILLDDFWTAYDRAKRGIPMELGHRTTSFKEWAHRLETYSTSERVLAQMDFWLSQIGASSPPLPTDFPYGLVNERALTIGFELAAHDTKVLLTEIPEGLQTALAAALVESLAPWTGSQFLLIDIEAHGREALFEDVDLSRTVGWFTATYPVLLSTEGAASWTEKIRNVALQLCHVPDGGIGYGALRYLSRVIEPSLNRLNEDAADEDSRADPAAGARANCKRKFLPEVSLNYLGQFDQSLKRSEHHAIPAEWAGPKLTTAKLAHLVEVNAMVTDGSLVITILFDESLYRATTIREFGESLLRSLSEIVTEAAAPAGR